MMFLHLQDPKGDHFCIAERPFQRRHILSCPGEPYAATRPAYWTRIHSVTNLTVPRFWASLALFCNQILHDRVVQR